MCNNDNIIRTPMLTFLAFTFEFFIWSLHSSFQKSVYYCLVISLEKCEYSLIWALNKSILSGSNSLKVSVGLCDAKSEKSFYYSLIFFLNLGFLSRTLTIYGTAGKEAISFTLLYHFHPLHRYLGISRAIIADNSPLHIPSGWTRTRNLWFLSASR